MQKFTHLEVMHWSIQFQQISLYCEIILKLFVLLQFVNQLCINHAIHVHEHVNRQKDRQDG